MASVCQQAACRHRGLMAVRRSIARPPYLKGLAAPKKQTLWRVQLQVSKAKNAGHRPSLDVAGVVLVDVDGSDKVL